jgi:hypothetical protein
MTREQKLKNLKKRYDRGLGRTIAQIPPPAWAALIVASLLLVGITFFIGAAAGGLDVSEACTLQPGQFYDQNYRTQHSQELRSIFPLSNPCNAKFDLVPFWVNPGLVILALLTLAFLTAFIVSLAKPRS